MLGIGESILKDLESCEVAKGVLQPFLQVKIMWEDCFCSQCFCHGMDFRLVLLIY